MAPDQAQSSDVKYCSINLSKSSWIQRLIPGQKMKFEHSGSSRYDEDMWISKNPELSYPMAADGATTTAVYENSRRSISKLNSSEQNQADTALKTHTGISKLSCTAKQSTSELRVSPIPLPLIESLIKGELRNANDSLESSKFCISTEKAKPQGALAFPFSNMQVAGYPSAKDCTRSQYTNFQSFHASFPKKTTDTLSFCNSVPSNRGRRIKQHYEEFLEDHGKIRHVQSRKMQEVFGQERPGCTGVCSKGDTWTSIKEDMLQPTMHENSVAEQNRTEASRAFHDFFKMEPEFGVRSMAGSGIHVSGFRSCKLSSTPKSKLLQNMSASATRIDKRNISSCSITTRENHCQDASKQVIGTMLNVASDRILDESVGPSNYLKPVADPKIWLERLISSKRKSYDQSYTNKEARTLTEFHWDTIEDNNRSSDLNDEFSDLRPMKRKCCEDMTQQRQCLDKFAPDFLKSGSTPSAAALAVIGSTARQVNMAQSKAKGFFGAWAASISSSSRIQDTKEPKAPSETPTDLKKSVLKPQKVSSVFLERASNTVDA